MWPKDSKFGERDAWIRFGVGLLGLAFSFGAAMFATALRHSGYVFLSAAVASFALLAAGLVGLYTVPYLAKRVARERWMEAFEYEVTKEGIVYLAAVLVISVAALNTGNNLLFIIISAMLAAVVVSGAASALTLRRLRVELTLPEHVFAAKATVARIRLSNRRRLPVFSIQVTTAELDRGKRVWRPTEFRFPPRRWSQRHWFTVNDWKLERERPNFSRESPLIATVYFPYLPPRSDSHADVTLTFPRRGAFRQRALAVSTRFPFSFVKKTRKIALEREVIVFPEVDAAERILSDLPAIIGECESQVRGQGNDLYRIRDHVAGDAARSVDWKATARSGAVMVKEFARDEDRRVRLVFDNPAATALPEAVYEEMVKAAASLAWELNRRGVPLEFLASEHHGSDLIDFLEYMAVVQPATAQSHLPDFADDAFTVVFTAGGWQNAGAGLHVVDFGGTASNHTGNEP